MITISVGVIALVVFCTLLCMVKQLYGRVKKLEKQAAEARDLRKSGLDELAGQLMDDYREDTAKQIKRVDEAIKILDERRSALENQINCARVMADTMVDAFKHQLSEAEQRRRKDDSYE